MIAAILGFIPALDRRRSMAIRSGRAANVVPNPATRPSTSERLKPWKSKLGVSRGMRLSVSGPSPVRPKRMIERRGRTQNATLSKAFIGSLLTKLVLSRRMVTVAPRPLSPTADMFGYISVQLLVGWRSGKSRYHPKVALLVLQEGCRAL